MSDKRQAVQFLVAGVADEELEAEVQGSSPMDGGFFGATDGATEGAPGGNHSSRDKEQINFPSQSARGLLTRCAS